MADRKPPGISFTSWIDQQVNEATERGAFDNLPGAGKPLPDGRQADAGQAWLRGYLRREGVSAEELLPTPLKLRKEVERLAGTVQDLHSEREVREVVTALNEQIMNWRRIPLGPPLFLPLVDEETTVSRWRDKHPAASSTAPLAQAGHHRRKKEASRPGRWHRLGRRRRSPG